VEEHGSFGQDADPRNILLTITPSTIIDGEPIMEGFMSKMEEKVDRDIEYDNALFRKCESTQSARMAGARDGNEPSRAEHERLESLLVLVASCSARLEKFKALLALARLGSRCSWPVA